MNPIDLKPTVSGSATMLSEHPRPAYLRVQVASDLHLEFIKRRFPGEWVIKPPLDVATDSGSEAIGNPHRF
jgi:hypothetical protein